MNQAKNILILGSIPGTDQEKVELYEALIDACKSALPTFTILSPMGAQTLAKDDNEKRRNVFQKIKKASLIIGDLTSESTAQGVEMREAETKKKPFIITAKTGSRISGIVSASPSLKMKIFYNDLNDVKIQLIDVLKTLEF
ncbi:MAG: hypothetical protein NTX91_01265 [candidate division SR1 bacterium]|nr:hypothetical protein [candidate division SR1 bacterium]